MENTVSAKAPREFRPTKGTPEAQTANALGFIAMCIAGIEWELRELNRNALKTQASLAALAYKAGGGVSSQ